jgi:copper transport protein
MTLLVKHLTKHLAARSQHRPILQSLRLPTSRSPRHFGGLAGFARLISKLLLLTVCVLFGGTIWASVALAHASVVSTSPEAGATVAQAPKQVTITFDQGVSVPTGGVRILNERAERIRVQKPRVTSETSQSSRAKPANQADQPNTVALTVPTLPRGAYVVSWRALSDDGHPIRGAFTFRVGSNGDQAAVAKLAQELLTNGKTDPTLSITVAVARALSFGSMLLLLGGVAFLLLVRSKADRNDARVTKLLTLSTVTAGVTGLFSVATFGPYVAGEGFGGLADGTLLDDTLQSAIGRSMLFRTVALVTVGVLTIRAIAKPSPNTSHTLQDGSTSASHSPQRPVSLLDRLPVMPKRSETATLVGLSTGVLWLSTRIGHGTTGRWSTLGAIATGLHLAAASTWIGLLVVVLVATSSRKPNSIAEGSNHSAATSPRAEAIRHSIERFSSVAFWSVAVLVATGALNAARQSGSIQGLTSTNYGRLLLVKLGIVSVLVGLGWLSRRSLAQRRAAIAQRVESTQLPSSEPVSTDPALPKRLPPALVAIRRRMLIESILASAVVGITALLVNAPPPIEVLGKPVSVTMRGSSLLLDTTISPAHSGENRIHFYALTPEGQTQAVEAMTVTASLPASDIAPIDLKVVRAGPNHFQALRADLPVKGSWRIVAEVQLDTFTAESVATTVTIR